MALTIESCSTSNNMVGVLRSGQEMGLQLRFASERGRLQDVRKMLASGAPILRNTVST